MNAALMLAEEGKIGLAKFTLEPLATNPHGGSLSEKARDYLDMLELAEEGTSWHPGATILNKAVVDAEKPGESGNAED